MTLKYLINTNYCVENWLKKKGAFKFDGSPNFDMNEVLNGGYWMLKNGLILGKILPIKGSSHLRAWYPIESIQLVDARIPYKQSKLKKRNILKYVVILKEHFAPQYEYYGFALLGNIYKNHVFGAWVRENYLWESGCKNFPHSEYFFSDCLLTMAVVFLRIWSFPRKYCVMWLVYSPFNFSVNLLLDKLLEVILEEA